MSILPTIHMQIRAFEARMLQCAPAAQLPLFNEDFLELSFRLLGMCIHNKSVPKWSSPPAGNKATSPKHELLLYTYREVVFFSGTCVHITFWQIIQFYPVSPN